MARKKIDIDMSRVGKAADKELAGALLKLIAVGFAGGLALIAGAKKAGEAILDAKAQEGLDTSECGEIEGEACECEAEAEVAEEDEEAVEPVPVVAEFADDIKEEE